MYKGIPVLGNESYTRSRFFRTVPVAHITGNIYMKRLLFAFTRLPYSRSCLKRIIGHPEMYTRVCIFHHNNHEASVQEQYVGSLKELRKSIKKIDQNKFFIDIRVYSRIDRSLIGSPVVVTKLLKKGYHGIHTSNTYSTGLRRSNIGRTPSNAWVGWCGDTEQIFDIGDMLYEPDFPDQNIPWNQQGRVQIQANIQSREAAEKFGLDLAGKLNQN